MDYFIIKLVTVTIKLVTVGAWFAVGFYMIYIAFIKGG